MAGLAVEGSPAVLNRTLTEPPEIPPSLPGLSYSLRRALRGVPLVVVLIIVLQFLTSLERSPTNSAIDAACRSPFAAGHDLPGDKLPVLRFSHLSTREKKLVSDVLACRAGLTASPRKGWIQSCGVRNCRPQRNSRMEESSKLPTHTLQRQPVGFLGELRGKTLTLRCRLGRGRRLLGGPAQRHGGPSELPGKLEASPIESFAAGISDDDSIPGRLPDFLFLAHGAIPSISKNSSRSTSSIFTSAPAEDSVHPATIPSSSSESNFSRNRSCF